MEGKSRRNEIGLPQFITVLKVLPAKACLKLDPSVCSAGSATAAATRTESAKAARYRCRLPEASGRNVRDRRTEAYGVENVVEADAEV